MKRSLLTPRLQLLFRSTCLFATSLTPLARAGEFLFDNGGSATTSTYPADWATANNWNPNTVPNGPLDNIIFSNVTGGMNGNPAALTAFDINGVTDTTLNQLRFTSTPLNATSVNLLSSGTATLTLNQIIVSGNVQNPPTAGGTAANNGLWQTGPTVELRSVVDPDNNPTGKLRIINTSGSNLRIQGKVTTGAGGLVKHGSGLVRLGDPLATFDNVIGGDIVINNGTLQTSNSSAGNPLGGTGRILINGPGSTLQMLTDYSSTIGRDVVINANATIATDRSDATSTGNTITMGTLVVGGNNKYLNLNSLNSYNYTFAGLNLGSNTFHIRNGLNNTANTDTTGHARLGALSGSGTLNVSGAGGNSVVGMTFNEASPAFTGRINLFENGSHIADATGAFGSGNVVLGEATNDLPITYPNIAIGSSGSPVVLSNPWASLLKYNANLLTTGTITVNGASQVNMGVVPEAGDKIVLRPFGIIQGNETELSGFDAGVGGNLTLPASDAVISHENIGGLDPLNLPNTASHFYGLSSAQNGPITVGVGTPWKGISNDRFGRTLGGSATTLTVNGGDDNPATVEVTFAGLNANTLTLLNTAGDTFASGTGQKFTVAINGYGSGFNGTGAGASPGGTVLIGRAGTANGLSANVDAIQVNSGNLQFNTLGGLAGVPLSINNNAGLDIAGVVGGALDGPININSGGTLVLNDNTLLTAAATNVININSGGRLHITGAATPPKILTDSTQPINFVGTGHTVRVSIDNVNDLNARVPDQGAIWEITSTGTNNNVANIWGTSFAANAGRTVIQTAGLGTDGGVFTNEAGGTRFLDAPLTIGTAGAIFAASTGTSLVFNDTTTNTPVTIGGGTVPVQIGSLTPINGIRKTQNPTGVNNESGVFENTHNGSPQIIFSNGLKSGTVNLVTGSLALDGPSANTQITGDLNMGEGTRLYLGDGGNLSFGNAATGAAPRRGDLTPLLLAGTVTSGTINVTSNARIELGIDPADGAVAGNLVGGRSQLNQSFTVAAGAELMDTDRRNFWINRSSTAAAAMPIDLNNINLGANANLTIQESNTDVRASINLSGPAILAAQAGGAGGYDLKNVSGTGSIKLGRLDMPFSVMGLYGSVAAGIPVENVYGRFEVRDGATLPGGFTFTDNAINARAYQSAPNTTPAGINAGTDHTLSIWKGQTGAGGTNLTTGVFNMATANNAAGVYVDDSASGSPLINDAQTTINLSAPGTVLFSARSNTDAAVNGTARVKEVNVSAPHSLLATRDLTDLEVTTLNVATDAVVKVAGARTDGRGAIRIGTVAAGANDVHFQDGRATITGNVTAGKLIVGGTSLELNPGDSATATVNASTVQVNTMLAARSGTVNFGSAVLTSSAPGTLTAGLLEGVILNASNNLNSPNPALDPNTANLYDNANTGVRLDPRAGNNNASDDNATITNDTARGWSRNQTWVYTGQIYDADGIFTLAENIDDNTQIIIDGVVVLSSTASAVGGTGLGSQAPFNSWATATTTATRDGLSGSFLQGVTGAGAIGFSLADTYAVNLNIQGGTTNFGMGPNSDGWHSIEIRIGNGSGGAGPVVAAGWGNYFGIGLNKDGTTSALGTDHDKPVDNGSMNLFRTEVVAKGNVDVDNGTTLAAGQLQQIGLLTFGRSGASVADMTVNLSAATAGDVESVAVATTAVGTSTLNLANAAARLVAGQMSVADAKVLNLNTAGSGTLEVTGPYLGFTNNTAAINLKGGVLQLSNDNNGSATGEASLTIEAGTLKGNGGALGPVLVKTGSTVAPGAVAGRLALGETTIEDASTIEWEVSNWNGAAGVGYDTLAVNSLAFTPGAGTVTLKIKQAALTGYSNANKTFVLASSAGTITNFTPAKIVLDTTGFTAGSGTWAVSQVGADLVLNYTAGAATPYDTWVAQFALGGQTGQNDDPDGDGKVNVLEFALNSNPSQGTGSGQDKTSGGIATVSGNPAAVFTLPVRTGATLGGTTELSGTRDGIRYRVQASTELTDWTLNVDEVTPAITANMPALDAGWEYRTFTVPSVVANTPRVFFRVVVEPAP